MKENIIPFRKYDNFPIYRGKLEGEGQVTQSDQLGMAFLKPGSKAFRLKLWMFPKQQFFLAPRDEEQTSYVLLALDEYQSGSQDLKKHWNKVGDGCLRGNYICVKFHLFAEQIFLCLFPNKKANEAAETPAESKLEEVRLPMLKNLFFVVWPLMMLSLLPEIVRASVESSLQSVQGKLTHVILPVLSVCGIAWAAFSLMTGNERAKTHMWYAIIGSAIGFGAQAIVDFISQTVR